jgi:ribitol-5-phosphate 2-dehydrogenase
VIGVDYSKLEKFTFVDEVMISDDITEHMNVDHAFECVGGTHSQTAINQIIDYINPEGTIAILGVSEYNVPLNTRMILEKGISIFGSSRSEREDFEKVVEIYLKYPEIVQYLSNIINQEIEINTMSDIAYAFESDAHKEYGKTIMKWNM